ncbi:MAG: hypothetical protein V4793_04440 [Paraburkholderia tropica]|uniref:hypothetical protein n=1 Tax=Burkholderia gladioli TaxID=28095 RepID=UPI00163F7786|nr:hypothetical protein [Burkholderia gladioli]
MLLDSQRYAIRPILAAVDWLVRIRYLARNPRVAVTDSRPVKRAVVLRVDGALSRDQWTRVRAEISTCGRTGRCTAAQAGLLAAGGLRAAAGEAIERMPSGGEARRFLASDYLRAL